MANLDKRLKDLEEKIDQLGNVVPPGYIACPPILNIVYGDGTPGEFHYVKWNWVKLMLDEVYGCDSATQEDAL